MNEGSESPLLCRTRDRATACSMGSGAIVDSAVIMAIIPVVGVIASAFVAFFQWRSARLKSREPIQSPMPSSQLSAQQSAEVVVNAYSGGGSEQYVFSKRAYEEFRRYEAQISLLEGRLNDQELASERRQSELIERSKKMLVVAAIGIGCAGILIGGLFGRFLSGGDSTGARTLPTTLMTSPAGSTSATTATSSDEASPKLPSASPGSAPSADLEALDVSQFDDVDFSSPSGTIWCRLSDDGGFCKLPDKHEDTAAKNACSGSGAKGVRVSTDAPVWVCNINADWRPMINAKSTIWHDGTRFGSVRSGEWELARLPYGKSLVHGDYVCASKQDGITCVNRSSGVGYRVSRSGVKVITGQ